MSNCIKKNQNLKEIIKYNIFESKDEIFGEN